MARTTHVPKSARRRFLGQLGAVIAAAPWGACAAGGAESQPPPAASLLPTIQLGSHRVTRLVAGWNPIGGHSYLGPHMDQHMRDYFTVERTVEFLLTCEQAGINAHQFSPSDKTEPILRQVRERGSKMNFIGLHSGREGIPALVASTQPIALAHHGGATDQLFSAGKSSQIRDYLKAAHDRGVLAGVSAHNPDCIRQIADQDWEVDFFMACFYFLTRKMFHKPDDKTPPLETLEIAYPFYRSDPDKMTQVVREVRKPCLGFKILGAGRSCENQQAVRQAFRSAFERIKPTDGVIVGMYPRFFDEIHANAQYTRELTV